MNLRRVLNLKSDGDDVAYLQTKLKKLGYFTERVDGHFGQNTLIAVTNFQRDNNLKVDGCVGTLTWLRITKDDEPVKDYTYRNDEIPYFASYMGTNGLTIYDYLLEDDEYIKQQTKKETIWLHHTAGGSRPDFTIDGWEKDIIKDEKGAEKSLKVSTSYVIGRKSSSTGDLTWDGAILKAFDDVYWSYHLGINKKSLDLNSKSIGIEICNYGPLKIGRDGRFYNYVNKPIPEGDVVKLDKPFRGYEYYEKYTDAQLESTRKLIIYLINKNAITIQGKIYNEDWFEYNDKWFSNGGIRCHSQVRKDKFDIFPQKEMIQMLNSL